VVDFKGGVDAKEVNTLRDEVSMILSLASAVDTVLVRLESGGGVVHGYGLGAAQLARLKTAGIPLTVAVDKIAASGGYMMACVADEIIAAPFAIVGSIGVIGQLPNVNRWLKKHDIDYEQHTAGEFKRTLTVLGENTPEAREKFKADLAEIHHSFNAFVGSHRPHMDLTKVTTGEHWLAEKALTLGLVDALQTSDDYLQTAFARHQVVLLRFQPKVSMASYLTQQGVQGILNGFISRVQSLYPWM
jgi:serine protease SohB